MLHLNSCFGFDFITCYYPLIDFNGSCSDIDRCYMVSIARETTLNTPERIPVWSIRSFIMPTFRTDMRSSSRINKEYRNTSNGSLVFNETSQLIERPRMKTASLSPSYRYRLANTLEVFKSYRLSCVFGFSHDLLGNNMINVTMETGFPVGKSFEMPHCGWGVSFLQVSSQGCVFLPDLINLLYH